MTRSLKDRFSTLAARSLAALALAAPLAVLAQSSAGGLTIYHMNDVHARITPDQFQIPAHSTVSSGFQATGGAQYLTGEVLSLLGGNPNSLLLDGGDISEGNPLGDMNNLNPDGTAAAGGASIGTFGDQGQTLFYEMLEAKVKAVAGRSGRGIDALVVGNHDVRDISYIQNMDHMAQVGGIPVISANVRDISTHQPHFPATTVVTVNGIKVGIIGYTTPTATVGASLASTMEVVQCGWNTTPPGAANAVNPCHIADYVNNLRNVQGAQIVILLTHDGHSDLVDPTTPVLADTSAAKVPEIAVTGHWHTWATTVWQPAALNYKTIFTESSSYMKYVGELNVDSAGNYVSSVQHDLNNANITPDPDVTNYVNNLKVSYQAASGHAADEIVGYSTSDLVLDDKMKWWSADEYPWSGNDTAGQWLTDAMKWNCDQIFSAQGGCDLSLEAGGGVRADMPAGAITYLGVYETYPWADDLYWRVNMTGQDIVNFLQANTLDVGISSALDVTAFDGIPTQVLMNGQPINLTQTYKVAISNYMYTNPPGGYTWTDPSPLTSTVLVRDSLITFMQQAHGTQATAYNVGGDRYHLNNVFSGGYRAVVTMMNDADSALTYDDAFIRFIGTTPETLARLGSKQVPTSLVNADGSIVASNRLAEAELYRSYMGFKTGVLKPGDIIETWGKYGFYGGDPEFVDQEGIYANGLEFKVVGHDPSLSKPSYMSSIGAFWNDNYKNHYVQFLAKKTGTSTVADQYGQTIQVWDKTGYTAAVLPGSVGSVLQITGVPTMENYALRLRSDSQVVSTQSLPTAPSVSSHIAALPALASTPVTLSATAGANAGSYQLTPEADSEVASGHATSNYGTSTNMYVQSSNTGYANERSWLKFDLSAIPAGSTITSASLQLWNWKSTGAALPVEVRGETDGWTETGLTWNSQPTLGNVLTTQTLASGAVNLWYDFDVTGFVQGEFTGDKTASFVLKAVTEGSTATTAPSYAFDTKEYGSDVPVLAVTTQATGASVAGVTYYYHYSTDNATWGPWTAAGPMVTTGSYAQPFAFPNGYGYYEFYSVATDSNGNTEPAPASAEAAVDYQAPSGSAQTITFTPPGNVTLGNTAALAATASSGLPVTFSSQTANVCTVSGSVVTTVAQGTCTITASQAGDSQYVLATSTIQSFSVLGQAQTITFPTLASQPLSEGSLNLSASASSGLGVSFSSQSPTVCSVSGNVANLLASGSCTIEADQPGNATYAAAAPVIDSFAVTSSGSGTGGNDPVQVPLPAWALWACGAGLASLLGRRAAAARKAD